jgi:hypothetical protein
MINVYKTIFYKSTKFFFNRPPREFPKKDGSGNRVKFEASGQGAVQIVNAQVQLQTAQNQLELTRIRATRAHQDKLKAQKELRDVTLDLIRLEIGIDSLEETVKIVSKGIKAIAEMSKHWKQFLRFFDEMSARVKIVLGKLDSYLKRMSQK